MYNPFFWPLFQDDPGYRPSIDTRSDEEIIKDGKKGCLQMIILVVVFTLLFFLL